MSINEIIIYIMVIFAALGALDRIFGSRFGLGEKFEEGIMAIGALAVSMVGIIALAPVIANLLKPRILLACQQIPNILILLRHKKRCQKHNSQQ